MAVIWGVAALLGLASWLLPTRAPVQLLSTAVAAEEPSELPVPEDAAGPTQSFAPIAKAVTPPVVNISTTRRAATADEKALPPFLDDPFFRDFFGEDFFRRFGSGRPQQGLGSGVIVSDDGHIVTNYHVIAQAEEIRVLLTDGREFDASVVGTDPQTDIAIIDIEGQDLPVLPWGDSDGLSVGEYVLAVGNPFALDSTVTLGIVSAVGRSGMGIVDYEDFIQTDAAINPGNSGGALVNTRGELVGINTAIFSRTGGYMGVGFAVPSNLTRTVMQELIEKGEVTRGYLGVLVQELNGALAREFGLEPQSAGVLVGDVIDGGPAAAAGMQAGDVLMRFDGREIESPTELRNAVAQTPIGEAVAIELVRDGEPRTLEVEIAAQPRVEPAASDGPSQAAAITPALAGLELQNLTPELRRELGLEASATGVAVVSIDPLSPGARAGLQPGDVIVSVNRQAIDSLGRLEELGSALDVDEPVLLHVNRGGRKLFVAIA